MRYSVCFCQQNVLFLIWEGVMYSVNGAFGKVRLVHSLSAASRGAVFSVYNAGWHKCNDLYRISRPRGNASHLLLMTVGGCGEMEVAGVRYSLPAGTIALIPHGLAHAYGTPEGGMWEFYWIHPSHGIAETFVDRIAQNGVYVGKCAPSHLYGASMETLIKYSSECSAAATLSVSHAISDILHFAAMDLQSEGRRDTVSERAITYIKERFPQEVSLAELAKATYLSEAHLIRVFKKEVGCTPHRYVLTYRLQTGAHLLRSGQLRVSEIAESVGFSSASQFISAFRRAYGCTPVQYRESDLT